MSNLSLICYPNGNGRLFYIIFFAVCRGLGCVHSEMYIGASYMYVDFNINKGHAQFFIMHFQAELSNSCILKVL